MKKNGLLLASCSLFFALIGTVLVAKSSHFENLKPRQGQNIVSQAIAPTAYIRVLQEEDGKGAVWGEQTGRAQEKLSTSSHVSEPYIVTNVQGASVAVWNQGGIVRCSWCHPEQGWIHLGEEAFKLSSEDEKAYEPRVYFDTETCAIVYWKKQLETGFEIESAAFNLETQTWSHGQIPTWMEKELSLSEMLEAAGLEPVDSSAAIPFRNSTPFAKQASLDTVTTKGGGIFAIARQSDGFFIIGGSFNEIGNTTRTGLALLNSSGVLQSFITLSLDNPTDDFTAVRVNKIVILNNNDIIIGGIFDEAELGETTVDRNNLIKINSNGTLNTDFPAVVNTLGEIWDIAYDSDGGNLILGGNFATLNDIDTYENTMRISTSGVVDTNYNPAPNDIVYTVCLQSNGKCVLGGLFTEISGIERVYIARINADGSLDIAFDPSPDTPVTKVVESGSNLYVGGSFTSIAGASRNLLARLQTSDGTIDTNFTPSIAEGYFVNQIIPLASGHVLVGGFINYTISEQTRHGLAKVSATDGSFDTSFNATSLFVRNIDLVCSSYLYPDETRIVLGGIFRAGGIYLPTLYLGSLTSQTITFGAISDQSYGDGSLTLTATASSELPVSYTIVEGEEAVYIEDGELNFFKTGTVTVTATQLGNETYASAPSVSRTFEILTGTQSITFDAIPDQSLRKPYIKLTATATSNLPVTFSVVSGSATVQGNIALVTGTGTVTIAANQAGNDYVSAAAEETRSFTVSAD